MDQIKRPHYFKGQFLKADDFMAEQQYHMQMRRLHNSSLHVWGVVDGLKVTANDSGITVSAGSAIGSDGKEIWLADDKSLPIPQSTANGSYLVVISHKEGYDPKSPYPPAGESESDDSKYIRKIETGEPSLIATTPAPANDGDLLKLALVNISGGKVTGQPDITVRRTAASFRANGNNLEIRPVTEAGSVVIGGDLIIRNRLQVGESIRRFVVGEVFDEKLGWGTSYVGFNAARIRGAASAKWQFDGDSVHNGGAVIWGDIFGNLRFASVPSTSGGGQDLTDSQVYQCVKMTLKDSGVEVAGNVNAAGFTGPGSGITGINASNIATGTLNKDRIPNLDSLNGNLPAAKLAPEIGQWTASGSNIYKSTTGNVGIGAQNPKHPLQVGDDQNVGTWRLAIAGRGNVAGQPAATSARYRIWTLRTGDGTTEDDIHKLRIRDENGNADRLVIDQNGNVGIGTANPDAMLSISQAQTPASDADAIPAMRIQGGKGGASTGQKGGKGAPIVITAGEGGNGFLKGDGGLILLRPGKAGTGWGNPSDPAHGKDGYVDVDGDVRVKGVISGDGGGQAMIRGQSGDGKGSLFYFKADNWSDAQIINQATGRVKNFIIDHPLDDQRYLVHATLEGPEGGVYYRGAARLENGRAEINLPHYFEALTQKDERTIILTNVGGFDRIAVEKIGEEKIKDGRFVVMSENPNSFQEFDWEVKAVRADVPPFRVEPRKSDIKVGGFGPYTYEIVE